MENLKKTYDKIKVAKDHLDVSIELFFNNKSPVTIHLLASACFAILRDLPGCKKSDFLKQTELIIKPGCEKEFYRQMNKHYNFFKHAKDDFELEIDFDERASDILLLHCCVLIGLVDKNSSNYVKIFIKWTLLFHPNLYNLPDNIKDIFQNFASSQCLDSYSRADAKKMGANLYLAQSKLNIDKGKLKPI